MTKLPKTQPTERACGSCHFGGPHSQVVMENGVHYAKVSCGKCGLFMGWLPKPDSDPTKYKRQNQHRDLVAAYGRGFCEMCLRRQESLPKGQTLEAQHVMEHQDGGSPERENIWILCTPCHRMVHWLRYYHGGDASKLIAKVAAGATEWMQ